MKTMKRLLLSAMFVCGAIFANAQTCPVGYSPTGIYDDYSSTTEDGGLYFGTVPGGGSVSRTSSPGKAEIFSTQAYGSYDELSLTFGLTGTGARKTIDLTGDKTYTIDITNPSSDTSSFTFRISIVDSLGKIINTKAAAVTDGNFNNAWMYGTSILVPPGETMTLSGTFAGGAYTDYNTSSYDQSLDFTIVSQVNFYYANSKQNASDGYKQYGLGNGSNPLVIIDRLRVGGGCSVAPLPEPSCQVGYTPTGIFDNYSSTTENGSLYFGTVPGSGSVSRTSNPGKAEIFSTQAYGSYDVLSLSFGQTATGAQRTINLLSDQTYTVDITNPSSDTSEISFQMSIVDSLGYIINTKYAAIADGNFNNAWMYGTSIKVPPGETKTLAGTYAGGCYTNYSNNTLEQYLDLTIVSQIWLYYSNSKLNASDGYRQYGLGNGSNPLLIIDNLRVGTCTATTGLFSPSVNNSNMTITPNPASSQVKVSYNDASRDLTFSVSDITGKVVKSVKGNGFSANISVSDLAKGMYFVTTISNNTPVSVSKLVVE
jgi:hypothetical protein